MENTKHKVYCAFKLPEKYEVDLNQRCDFRMCQHKFGTQQELLEAVRDGVDAIMCTNQPIHISHDVLKTAGSSLKVVCTVSAGYNHIDLEACRLRNVRIGYTGAMLAETVAEFTIGLMIATGRKFKTAMTLVTSNTDIINRCYGQPLKGSTVGIVGLGNIGQALARMLMTFNVKQILYSGPRRKQEGDVIGAQFTTFTELIKQSDFVVATCCLNDETRKMFNKEVFNLMKPTSVFINVSRGGIVDQEALYEALELKAIAAAGLDVTHPEPMSKDDPLTTLENCLILPHIAPAVKSLHEELLEMTINNVFACLNGQPMPCECLK